MKARYVPGQLYQASSEVLLYSLKQARGGAMSRECDLRWR